jgi:hypothetical protein
LEGSEEATTQIKRSEAPQTALSNTFDSKGSQEAMPAVLEKQCPKWFGR